MKLVWSNAQRKISELVAYKGNPRKMTPEGARLLLDSIEKFGLVEVPAVNLNNKILAGHQRITAMKTLGMGGGVIDVRVPNRMLSKQEEKEYMLRSNKNVGEWDWEKLQAIDLETLKLVGFAEDELKMMFSKTSVNDIILDEERIKVITIEPPEAPELYERLSIHCKTIEEYDKIKKFFGGEKRVDAAKLSGLIK